MATDDRDSSAVGFHVFGSIDKEASRSIEDLNYGAQYVPKEVEHARQAGEKVIFVTDCGPCCWYWELPGGLRIYHCEQVVREDIARQNGRMRDGEILGNDAGPCSNPRCGNTHTNSETVRSQ